jgi:hypothetical protein
MNCCTNKALSGVSMVNTGDSIWPNRLAHAGKQVGCSSILVPTSVATHDRHKPVAKLENTAVRIRDIVFNESRHEDTIMAAPPKKYRKNVLCGDFFVFYLMVP